MVLLLITPEEQEKIFVRLIDYYKKLYPGVAFKRADKALSKNDVADLYYTYPGEEEQAHAEERMNIISEELAHGYSTPIIGLQKKGKTIVLDGHRRTRVAFEKGVGWKALLIVPQKDLEFGMEEMILGKVKEVFGRKKEARAKPLAKEPKAKKPAKATKPTKKLKKSKKK